MVFDNFKLRLPSEVIGKKQLNSNLQKSSSVSTVTFTRNLLNNVRTYFNGRYTAVNKNDDDDDDDLMFPRVYSQDTDYGRVWDPVELKAKDKVVEELDNVVDKFLRVINVDGNSSPASLRRSFYVGNTFIKLYSMLMFANVSG